MEHIEFGWNGEWLRGRAVAAKKAEKTRELWPELGTAAFVGKLTAFPLDAVQMRVLESQSKRVLFNCCRQFGKSTVTAGKAVDEAVRYPASLILVASPSLRQSGEFLRKAERFIAELGFAVRGDGDNGLSLLLPNGSRIVGLPGNEDTVRGFSAVRLLILDEASRISDALYQSLRPSVIAANGTIWALSTPNGRRGFFWRSWMGEGEEWERVEVPAWECPRYTKEQLDRERRVLGGRVFAQEYECQFVDADDQLMQSQALEGAVREGVRPIELFEGGQRPWFVMEDAQIKWREYLVGVDLGKLRNPSAIAVVEKKSVLTGRRSAVTCEWEEVITTNVRYLERLPVGLAYGETVERIRDVVRDPELQKGKVVELVVDAGGVGEAVLEQLHRSGPGCEILPVTLTGGREARKENGKWYVPKVQLLMDLAVMLEAGDLGIAGGMALTERLLSELRGFRVTAGERGDRIVGGADEDGKNDLAFAVALAGWRARRIVRDLWGRRRVV